MISSPQNQTKVQKDFLHWFQTEQEKGLKDLKFYPGDVSQATIDSFIEESNAIDQAIENGQHSPLPAEL